MKNKIIILMSLFILALIVMPLISGLGITPGRTTINFEPGLDQTVQFSVLNSEHKNMNVIFLIQGELNSSISIFENNIDFLPSEESKPFSYRIKLPDKMEPGLHTAEIVALEVPKANEKGTFVGATVAVTSQLYVYVPCPGKCIETDLNVMDAEPNSTATLIVPVINRGKVGIGDVRAIIDIYTGLNEKITSIETDAMPLEAGKRTELSAKWIVNVNSGNYIAKVTVFYDDESKDFEKQFAVGTQTLSIESILVNEFNLGDIAKLRILVENRWSQEVKEVFANLLVYNHDNQVMADVKSASENIPPLAKKELIAYWDTVGVNEGEYDGKLMVKYGKKSTDKNLVLKVSESSLDIKGVGYAIRPQGGRGVNLTTILLIVVILLLLVNVAWFVFFRRFMAGKKEKKEVGKGVVRVPR